MIVGSDLEKIKQLSKKYGVGKVVLFGSSLDPSSESNDIDLAIDDIAPQDYYRYCGELMMSLTKPVDVIDLRVNSKFVDIVLKEGSVIYG